MGQCGCGDFHGDFKFKGPDGITYVLDVYPSCDYCNTPAGIILYAMGSDDCKIWGVDHIPEIEILDIGTCVAVIDPADLIKKADKLIGGFEGIESDFHHAFINAVHKSIKNNKRLHRTQNAGEQAEEQVES